MSGAPRQFEHALRAAAAPELAEVSLGPATKFAALPDPFPFWRGGELHDGRVAYETWGELNTARDNAILLFTGLSPSAHAASSPQDPSPGWWEKMVGPGKAIDTDRYFVICVNSLGSCFGSSGPASIDPATGLAYRLDFPDLSVEDIARGGFEVVRTLGIKNLSAVVGASLGGMVVLAFATQFAGVARRVISISGSPAASPFAIALRSLQRDAILTDPEWRDGQYSGDVRPTTGMRLARKLGTITYRSAAEWKHRFGRRPSSDRHYEALPPGRAHFPAEFAVQDYLNAQADKFVSVFDPNCYLYLSRAMDRFDLSAHGGNPAAALKRAAAEKALVIGVESDILFTIKEQNAIAEAFEAVGTQTEFVPLASLEGHDAFLVDIEPFAAAIGRFLAYRGPIGGTDSDL
jgi:homoserine O-acetyltransferase